jgi:hypothetical protein
MRLAMRPSAALAALALAAAGAGPSGAEGRGPLFDAAWAAWHAGDWRGAYEGLRALRAEPYGREAVVDFMLGTSACRIDGVVGYGARLLDWMLYAYALTLDSRRVVQVERDLCVGVVAAAAAPPQAIVELRSAGMTGFGKTFYWANAEAQPVTSYPIRRTREIAREELAARRAPRDDPAAALAVAAALAPGAPAVAEDGFLVIGHGGQTEGQLAAVARLLGDYRDFLVRAYGMLSPSHHIRVELAPGTWEVRALADARHALDVSPAIIGYAFVDDASIVAAVPGEAAGTALHELFHLLVRSNFGDVPQWLDEGVASVYEVSAREGDGFVGRDNWRREVLEDTWALRPDVETLIRAEWFVFDDPGQAGREPDAVDLQDPQAEARRAATMAMARYFAMYLDARGALRPVFAAVRDRGFDALGGEDPGAHVVGIVEAVAGADAAALDAGFVAWFEGRAEVAPTPRAEGGPLYATTADLNVRTGPGRDFERLATLPGGTIFTATGETEGAGGSWLRLELSDGTTGFASRDYARPVEAIGKWSPSE